MNVRTDLALEAHESLNEEAKEKSKIDGVMVDVKKEENVTITKIGITNKKGEEALNKPVGNYITIEAPNIKYSSEDYETACYFIKDSLIEMVGDLKNENEPVLIAGLGNTQITPDALGPSVLSKLIITRHMKGYKEDYFSEHFGTVCAIAPGVLGTTGIETQKILKGVVNEVKPKAIIAVDALAARSADRISTTIQICDTGIQPGEGVGNRRDSLNYETLGVPVIAVGVPTVVDATTIARDTLDAAFSMLGENKIKESNKERLIYEVLSKNKKSLVVTPKDIDLVIERASKTVANGINLALHKSLSLEEIESFVG